MSCGREKRNLSKLVLCNENSNSATLALLKEIRFPSDFMSLRV